MSIRVKNYITVIPQIVLKFSQHQITSILNVDYAVYNIVKNVIIHMMGLLVQKAKIF